MPPCKVTWPDRIMDTWELAGSELPLTVDGGDDVSSVKSLGVVGTCEVARSSQPTPMTTNRLQEPVLTVSFAVMSGGTNIYDNFHGYSVSDSICLVS